MKTEFREHWKNYVFQSLFATIAVSLIIIFLNLQNAVVIASLGSTTFVIFALPKSITARPRNVIGGNLACLAIGSLCHLIPHASPAASVIVYSLAVGISIFVMVVTDIEHPPASGLALGVAITGFSVGISVAVVTFVIILSLIHYFCRDLIRDLV